MKFILTTSFIVVTFAWLSFMVETNMANEVKAAAQPTLIMDVLQSILKDPEFLALDSQQQLQVLIIVHDMLAVFYKSRFFLKKKIKIRISLMYGFLK